MAENYHAYLVRLWREDETAPWRLRAQSAQGDRAYLFASVEELTIFLVALTCPAPPVSRRGEQATSPNDPA